MKIPNAIVPSHYGPCVVNLRDQWVGRNIIENGYCGQDEIDFIIGLIERRFAGREHVVFYDVGANIGTISLAVAQRGQSHVTVRAFEAQRLVFYMLCGSIAINGLSNVHCHHAAVSDHVGDELTFEIPDYVSWNNFASLELLPSMNSDNHLLTKSGTETVTTTTIDSFEEQVDFIKMDIEGMEDKALRGAVNLLQTSRPIVYAEIAKTDQDFLRKFMADLDYVAHGEGWSREHGTMAVFQPSEHFFEVPNLARIL